MAAQTTANAKTPSYSFKRKGFAAFLLVTDYQSQTEFANLSGCLESIEKLKNLLPYFNFEVAIYDANATMVTFKTLLDEWDKHDFSEYDTFFLYVLAHGVECGPVLPVVENGTSNSDNVENSKLAGFRYDAIELPLRKNLTLAGKPKWIIFDCCRGKDKMLSIATMFDFKATAADDSAGTTVQQNTISTLGQIELKPQSSDFLITSASVKGYVAYAQKNGTVLSNVLYGILNAVEENNQVSMDDILKDINRKVCRANEIQMSTHSYELTQTLFLTKSSRAQEVCHYLFKPYYFLLMREDVLLATIEKLDIGKEEKKKLLVGIEQSKVMYFKGESFAMANQQS